MEITQLSYLAFHFVIIASLVISKLLYKPMKFPALSKVWLTIQLGTAPLLILDLLVSGYFWWFAESRILPLPYFFTIPIEELLFFITVPYALLTIDQNLSTLPTLKKLYTQGTIFPSLVLLFGIGGLFFLAIHWLYTGVISIMLAISLIVANQFSFIKNARFMFILGITLVLTAIFNMYLTAIPIVIYNVQLKSNTLFGTIPYEDFLFATVLVLNLFTAKAWNERHSK